MHIQVVTFNLKDMTDGEYRKWCDELAPIFGNMPGLISKVWLEDKAANTYGGVYTWRDRSACEAYIKGDIFQALGKHPNITNASSKEFDIIEGPTRISHGLFPVAA